jgi:PAS domain S-box-containing protein
VLLPPDRSKEEAHILAQIRIGRSVEHYETIRRRKDGTEVPVALTASPVRDSQGRVIGASEIAHDITHYKESETFLRKAHDELERRVEERTAELTQANAALHAQILAHHQIEQALRQTEARLQAFLDHSPEMIFLKDTKGRYLIHNRQFQEAFHLPPEGAIGKTDFGIFPRRQAVAARSSDQKVFQTGEAIQFESVLPHNGIPRVAIVSKFPVYDDQGKIYALGGIVTDITERRRLEGEVLRISEHEQQRIARDLHDSLGQQIAGAWYMSDILRKTLAAESSPELPAATKVAELLATTVSQTRNLAHGLSPVAPQPDGLMTALERLATQTSEMFHVRCRFIRHNPAQLTDNTAANHFYRIAQEAVNNAVKHGHPRQIEIGLSAVGNCVTLRIKDDGRGFNNDGKLSSGMGLRTMKYRADLMGADFAVNSRRGGGTEIVCELRTDS